MVKEAGTDKKGKVKAKPGKEMLIKEVTKEPVITEVSQHAKALKLSITLVCIEQGLLSLNNCSNSNTGIRSSLYKADRFGNTVVLYKAYFSQEAKSSEEEGGIEEDGESEVRLSD